VDSELSIVEVPANDLDFISKRIRAYLEDGRDAAQFNYSPHAIGLSLEREGETVGGLVGEVHWDWFYIKLLAVSPEVQGQGCGRSLVGCAEQLAREKRCIGIWVNTYSFQAPGFYLSLGFQEFGRLPDNPIGHDRVFFFKRF
jgi:GNAT superfamily N-acetyltransferase